MLESKIVQLQKQAWGKQTRDEDGDASKDGNRQTKARQKFYNRIKDAKWMNETTPAPQIFAK